MTLDIISEVTNDLDETDQLVFSDRSTAVDIHLRDNLVEVLRCHFLILIMLKSVVVGQFLRHRALLRSGLEDHLLGFLLEQVPVVVIVKLLEDGLD